MIDFEAANYNGGGCQSQIIVDIPDFPLCDHVLEFRILFLHQEGIPFAQKILFESYSTRSSKDSIVRTDKVSELGFNS